MAENGLAGQTSPYLLQHVQNPVNWQPWGEPALRRAAEEDKPIFLSIGYAACHWCHVMERESFENDEIAAYLNEHFISIKVDREERPDIDEIYMHAVQLLTGAGGWPLTAFLTPDLKPFAGGTYFPPEDRYGRIGFPALLRRVVEVWESDRARVDEAGNSLTERLIEIAAAESAPSDGSPVGRDLSEVAFREWTSRFDARWGGFGAAPKFPADAALTLLLREARREGDASARRIATTTLDGMANGGLFDHLGGGFARYSVDDPWLVPHFEKMLYNQALLVPVYLEGWQLTEADGYRQVVERTLDFVRREMTDPGGGFWSSLDADSEGVEGKFYVWSKQQVEKLLGDDAERFCEAYDVSAAGNFEGANILNRIEPGWPDENDEAFLAPLRAKLLAKRGERIRPGTDDKVLTSWNGLMISAYCRAYQQFGRAEDLASAQAAAQFIVDEMMHDDRLRASWRAGQAAQNGYLDDYAFFGRALLDLFESDGRVDWLELSVRLADSLLKHFRDERGLFFFTSDDHEQLLTRNRSQHDGALPAGGAVATQWLQRLAQQSAVERFAEAARQSLVAHRPLVERTPGAFANMLLAAEEASRLQVEIAINGEPEAAETQPMLDELRRRRRFDWAVAVGRSEASALLKGRISDEASVQVEAYLCRNGSCQRPTSDPIEFGRMLDALLLEQI